MRVVTWLDGVDRWWWLGLERLKRHGIIDEVRLSGEKGADGVTLARVSVNLSPGC